jgi:hypothetical protein
MINRIEWDFILDMFHFLSFGSLFIGVTMTLFSISSFRVCDNDHLSKVIPFQISIKEYFHLAPYLYVIVYGIKIHHGIYKSFLRVDSRYSFSWR